MNNILLFLFVSFFIVHNAQASDLNCVDGLVTPTKKYKINPNLNLFEKEEQFSVPEKKDLVLKVTFSEPIYRVVEYIDINGRSDPEEPRPLFKIFTKNSTFFDIISDEICVGKVKTDIMPDALDQVYIRKIKTNEEHQRKGIGTKALSLVVQFYLQKGFEIKSFGAQIKEDNVASIKVFEKNGFSTNGKVRLQMLSYGLRV
jgi:GNAT superfamily N-acetyltransferase